jgi:predicted DCC family thiol-disulfide oxidoreductase YuxK
MHEHLIFFDAECPLCHRAVQHILEIDQKRRFIFAPLEGETARAILTGPLQFYRKANTLVLLENYQSTEREFWIRSKSILRVYWLVGNGWQFIGWLSFLPSWIGDLFYSWVAKHRHQFKLRPMHEIGPQDRFLP